MKLLRPCTYLALVLSMSGSLAARDRALTYGGVGREDGAVIQARPDGRLVVAGSSDSFGAGQDDAILFELDEAGAILRERAWGTGDAERVGGLVLEDDGGQVVTGTSENTVTGERSAFVLRLDADGEALWQRRLELPGDVSPHPMLAVADGAGGLILALSESLGPAADRAWVVSLDPDGDLNWSVRIGGSGPDVVNDLCPRPGGGALVVVTTGSFFATTFDVLLVALAADGTVDWHRVIDAGWSECGQVVLPTADGGFRVGGYAGTIAGSSFDFAWLTDWSAEGELRWSRRFDGPDRVAGLSLRALPDGGTAIAGSGWIRDPAGRPGDAWFGRLDADGELVWQRGFGGSDWDRAGRILQRAGGGPHVVAGVTESFGAGYGDFWILQVDDLPAPGQACELALASSWSMTDLAWSVGIPPLEREARDPSLSEGNLIPSPSALSVSEPCEPPPKWIGRPVWETPMPFAPSRERQVPRRR